MFEIEKCSVLGFETKRI